MTNNTNAKAAKATETKNAATMAASNNTNAKAKKLTPQTAASIAAALLTECGTMSAIKGRYNGLCAQYGKDNAKAIISAAGTIRKAAIDSAAAAVMDAVTYDGQLLAAYDQATTANDWPRLAQYACIATPAADASKAARLAAAYDIISKYSANVDASGQPMAVVWYANDKGTTALMTYAAKAAKATTAAAWFLAAVAGIRRAANYAATHGIDTNARPTAKIRECGKVYAAKAIGKDASGHPIKVDIVDANGLPLAADVAAAKYAAVMPCNTEGIASGGWLTWSEYAASTKAAK